MNPDRNMSDNQFNTSNEDLSMFFPNSIIPELLYEIDPQSQRNPTKNFARQNCESNKNDEEVKIFILFVFLEV